jgi:hypothetical protein
LRDFDDREACTAESVACKGSNHHANHKKTPAEVPYTVSEARLQHIPAGGHLTKASVRAASSISFATLCNAAIDGGKIGMRPNDDFNNVANQEHLWSLLMEYATPWLNLGLENIFCTVINEPQTTLDLKPHKPTPS